MYSFHQIARVPFTRNQSLLMVVLAAIAISSGCERKPSETAAPPANTDVAAAPTNRVDINAAVRQNLGVSFANVVSRNVARTLRVPGRFELLPTALREYRVPVAGKVELLVQQYQQIEMGTPLYRLDSPRWRELQRELTDAVASLRLAEAGTESIGPILDANEQRSLEIQNAVNLWTERVATLNELQTVAGVRGADLADARASLGTARTDFAELVEKRAEVVARQREVLAQLDAAHARMAILLETAASFTGWTVAELLELNGDQPSWPTIQQIEVRALSPGVVDIVNAISGSFVEQNSAVLTTVEPELVRFRAHGLQSDIGYLATGMDAAVVSPQGGSLGTAQSVRGTLTIAPTADPERRTVELIMSPSPLVEGEAPAPWVRAGISAFLEVVVSGDAPKELAIPLASVTRDGTHAIIFRRDPKNPDKAIRMDADLGIDDGRWVVIKSGVAEGDEVVLNGVYQLMVATSGSITKGGHFHPDGSFHEGDK